MKKFNNKLLSLFFFLLIIFFAHSVSAAELNLSPSTGSYNVGDTIKVRIVLSSSSQSANAVSGSLTFSNNLMSLTSVSRTGSLISLWPLNPSFSNENGTLDMEGVILNGFTGSNGTILTLYFKAKATGTASIKFKTSSVLADDGQGTNILTNAGQASFDLSAAKDVKTSTPAPVSTSSEPQQNQINNTTTLIKLTTPVITDYSKDLKEGEFLVIKGFADPFTDIIITSNSVATASNEVVNESKTIQSDHKGIFTYVSERVNQGTYMISAQARNQDGVLSDQTLPVKISVTSLSAPNTATKIINTISFIVPIVALVILLTLLLIWGWYKALHIRTAMRKKIAHTKELVLKSFDILDEDIEEEMKVFRKIKTLQPLTPTERNLITQLQKDIESAEKTIINDLKDSEK